MATRRLHGLFAVCMQFLICIYANAAVMPLSTEGRFVIDATGTRFKLSSINWYGAQDRYFVVGGLDQAPLATIVSHITSLGFNSVRLPFSNAMLRQAHFPSVAAKANPDLIGKSPLEVFDAVVKALTDEGIVVILNNHNTEAHWCCGYDQDGLWYTENHSEDDWIADWEFMVKRYAGNPLVAGADLRNEVRIAKWKDTILPSIPNWGKAPNDWRKAAEKAGDAVHHINPNLLVIVEGINFPRYHLRGVRHDPIRFKIPHKLVYGAHNYGYIGPTLTGVKYRDYSMGDLHSLLYEEWGYVATGLESFTAPIWVSEFGVSSNAEESDKKWFYYLTSFLEHHDLDWAYWPLNSGPTPSGAQEYFGLVTESWSAPLSDWRTDRLKELVAARLGPGVDDGWATSPERGYSVLTLSDWDNDAINKGDWAKNSYKAHCNQNQAISGISIAERASTLLTHAVLCSPSTSLVQDRPIILPVGHFDAGDSKDWAFKLRKTTCPKGFVMGGLAQKRLGLNYALSAVSCIKHAEVTEECQAIRDFELKAEFPRDWDLSHKKLTCPAQSLAVGLATHHQKPNALLCCRAIQK